MYSYAIAAVLRDESSSCQTDFSAEYNQDAVKQELGQSAFVSHRQYLFNMEHRINLIIIHFRSLRS